MTNPTLIDDTLLGKFLAGEATPEEAMQVNDWIEASEENKTRYQQFEKIWFAETQEERRADKEEVWRKLQPLLKNKTVAKQIFFTPFRLAASLALLVGAGIVIYFWNLNPPDTLTWEAREAHQDVVAMTLPDGSSVTMNRKSHIQWPKGMEGPQRNIVLKGEAYFDVSHNPSKPFVITVDDIRIKVLGTAFNVQNDSIKNEVETEVTRGKVLMSTSHKEIIIEAGMKGIYRRATGELSLEKLVSENNIAYATRALSFSNTSLDEVTRQLSKAYGVQFVFTNTKLKECPLTTEYHNQSLSFIMDVIAESLHLTYEIKDNTVFISGDGCF